MRYFLLLTVASFFTFSGCKSNVTQSQVKSTPPAASSRFASLSFSPVRGSFGFQDYDAGKPVQYTFEISGIDVNTKSANFQSQVTTGADIMVSNEQGQKVRAWENDNLAIQLTETRSSIIFYKEDPETRNTLLRIEVELINGGARVMQYGKYWGNDLTNVSGTVSISQSTSGQTSAAQPVLQTTDTQAVAAGQTGNGNPVQDQGATHSIPSANPLDKLMGSSPSADNTKFLFDKLGCDLSERNLLSACYSAGDINPVLDAAVNSGGNCGSVVDKAKAERSCI
jgi:hypothetical protein